MTWIRLTVKTVHLLVLLLVCGIGFYNISVTSQEPPPSADKKEENVGALTVVPDNDQQEQDDDVSLVEVEDEITIENPEPFIPTNEWQILKPGQAIPRGLHVRLNIQTGQREARLLQKDTQDTGDEAQVQNSEGSYHKVGDKISFDDLKKAAKAMKSEELKSVDMETLRKENQFRSYEELKADMEKINVDIQTDSEVISKLVDQFQTKVKAQEDVTSDLQELEYYLHQIDNAMLFCDLGAMPVLLQCLNSSKDSVRSEAALVLGSALQSNPKVQISAIENGAMHEVLRLIAFDLSTMVRKRAVFALSSMVQHFPFAQKRFLEMGGLSVLGKLFDNKTGENLQVRAVTLLTDLIKEKQLHSLHSDTDDSAQGERLRQYAKLDVQEAMVESGWCSLISSLLVLPEHDSREKVLIAMETVLPACETVWRSSLPVLKSLQKEYRDLLIEEQNQSQGADDDDDGFYQGLVNRVEAILAILFVREEL